MNQDPHIYNQLPTDYKSWHDLGYCIISIEHWPQLSLDFWTLEPVRQVLQQHFPGAIIRSDIFEVDALPKVSDRSQD